MAATKFPAGASVFLHGLWAVIWPGRCPLCGELLGDRLAQGFCPGCSSLIAPIPEPACDLCGKGFASETMPAGRVCGQCQMQRPLFDRARSFGLYDGALAQSIRDFKFKGKRALLPALQELMRQADRKWLSEVRADLVVPVPLHERRLIERGYNQARDLAEPVARQRRIPLLSRVLLRVRDTEPQFGLSWNQRRENLKGAFMVRDRGAVKDKTVLLVDDIMTTGITVTESVKALKKAGAKRVVVLTLARTA